VTIKDLNKVGGSSLLHKYNDSLSLLLSTVYPEYEWLPWKFIKSPRNYWENVNNQRKYIEWAGKQLNIKQLSDWYKVTRKVLAFSIFSQLLGHTRNWWRRSTSRKVQGLHLPVTFLCIPRLRMVAMEISPNTKKLLEQ
jgi:hypothetical protein